MNKNIKRTISPYIALLFIMIVVYFITGGFGGTSKNITYSQFQKYLKDDKVDKIVISPNSEGSTYNIEGKLKESKKNETPQCIKASRICIARSIACLEIS